MTEKIDRRQIRTKQLLYQALMSLIEEKGFENVTVTDIANRAEVNRGTFYLHYRDVPDMLHQLKEEVFGFIQNAVRTLNPLEVREYAYKDEPYPKFIAIFEEVGRHAEFLKVMFGPKGDISFAIKVRESIASQIYNKWTPFQQQDIDTKLLIPRDYLIAYMSSANIGILMHWLASGLNYTPYQMAMMMTRIVNHGPIVASGLIDGLTP
ncbi:TetR/AcrR family transcriptional regulator [Cohnella endophytica]|uniref:TetR/AcrR family transcriptional regulator n=1 Tax=Cohnella endophytica TaxID=2419778 RepID=A0A494XL90_9BACL|nr:TetR/AcrR family transcriptional regulator [Cohnella endophytica]RKP51378.1 TetR/AcrR family transcriptional regulator [Cohnella endophytica]